MSIERPLSHEGVLRRLPLRVNIRWTFAGNVVNSIAQWGMLAALAKLGNADAVGQFTLGLYIAAPVMVLSMMQLRMIQATDAAGEFRFAHYFGTRLILSIAGIAVIVGVTLAAGYTAQTAWVIVLVGLAKSVESVSEIIRGLFQRFERMDRSGTSLMIKGPAALGGLALVMWWSGNIIWAAGAISLLWLAALMLYDLPQARRLQAARASAEDDAITLAPSFDRAKMAALIARAAPLAIGSCLLTLQARIPGYLLERFDGVASLGYFGAMVYTMVVGTLIVSALAQSASPRLAHLYAENPARFRRLVGKLAMPVAVVGVIYVLGAWLLGRPLLALLYKADYADHHIEFVIVAVASAFEFLASLLGTALIATRVFRVQLISGAATCLLVWIPGLLLIPRYGLRGAAWTLVCVMFVKLMCHLAGFIWLLRRRRTAGPVAVLAEAEP
jgi:O-antigen/teichoic acid export membrane protein